MNKKITGLHIYQFASVVALIFVVLLFIFGLINDITIDNITLLLCISSVNVLMSFVIMKKR